MERGVTPLTITPSDPIATFFFCFLSLQLWDLEVLVLRDFPGSPVVKTSPSTAGVVGSIPGWGAKVPHALGSKKQNIKQKQYCNKFNKDF